MTIRTVLTSHAVSRLQDMPVQGERPTNLPVDRTPPELPTFGYYEPDRVPYGRATLRTAIGFISAYTERPDKVTAASIASKHKLDERVVGEHRPADFADVPCRVRTLLNMFKALQTIIVREVGGSLL